MAWFANFPCPSAIIRIQYVLLYDEKVEDMRTNIHEVSDDILKERNYFQFVSNASFY